MAKFWVYKSHNLTYLRMVGKWSCSRTEAPSSRRSELHRSLLQMFPFSCENKCQFHTSAQWFASEHLKVSISPFFILFPYTQPVILSVFHNY